MTEYGSIFLFLITFSLTACKPSCSTSSNTISAPIINIESQNINLGAIPLTENIIVGVIKYSNVGSEELKILKVIGSCTCFISSSGNTHLLPGQKGELVVKFDKNKLQHGFQRRSVDIVTNDSNQKTLKVSFDFLIQEAPAKDDLCLLPPVIDYGRVTKAAFDQVIPINIIIPYKHPNETVEIQVEPSTNSLQICQIANQISDNSGILKHNVIYHLSWIKPPSPGIFIEHIIFVIQGDGEQKNKKEVELSIRGDVVSEEN